MQYVYLLMHERADDGHVKIIGVYSSEAAAEAARERVVRQPGFRDYPKGFTIDAYQLDLDCWPDGFADL